MMLNHSPMTGMNLLNTALATDTEFSCKKTDFLLKQHCTCILTEAFILLNETES